MGGFSKVPVAAILALVAKGMTAREICRVFPELAPADVREALLQAAEVLRDADASARAADPVGAIIRRAQESSGLSDDAAMALAVAEVRAYRREKAERK